MCNTRYKNTLDSKSKTLKHLNTFSSDIYKQGYVLLLIDMQITEKLKEKCTDKKLKRYHVA